MHLSGIKLLKSSENKKSIIAVTKFPFVDNTKYSNMNKEECLMKCF